MGAHVVEAMIREGRFGPVRRLRIDLHGISTFGPGRHHSLIRWERLCELSADAHGVTASSPTAQIVLPAGLFGCNPVELSEKLEHARSIFERADVLAELSGGAPAS
jgi:hypothetical protein